MKEELIQNWKMHPCPVTIGIDSHLVPWPGLKYACVKVLEAYCKVFNQQELYEFIVRLVQNYKQKFNLQCNDLAQFLIAFRSELSPKCLIFFFI